VRTLATLPGGVIDLALVGDRIVWSDGAGGYPCPGHVWAQSLRTGRRTQLYGAKGTCSGTYDNPPVGLVFDGSRALWGLSMFGNTEYSYTFFVASVDDPTPRGIDELLVPTDGGSGQPLATAGARGTLVYFAACLLYDSCSSGHSSGSIRRVSGRSFVQLVLVGGVGVLAVSPRTLAAVSNGVHHPAEASSAPAWSPDGRTIAFSRGGEIYTVGADGTALRRLTSTKRLESAPDWSPDGRQIAVAAATAAGAPSMVYLIDVATGVARLLGPGWAPAWTPDGSAIAVVRVVDTRWEISLVDPVDGASARVTFRDDQVNDLSWSPDGTRLGFAAQDGLFTIARTGGDATKVLGGPYWSVDWAPGGNSLLGGTESAYDQEGNTHLTILAVRPDGTGAQWISRTDSIANDSDPAWSPDGMQIVFVSDRLLGWPALFLANADDGSKQRLLVPGDRPKPAVFASFYNVSNGRHLADVTLVDNKHQSVAVSDRVGAMMLVSGKQYEFKLFNPRNGRLLRTVPAPRSPTSLSVSGSIVVFNGGRTIFALDARTGKISALAQANIAPKRLWIEGRRVAWAEVGSTRSRIRALVLP